MAVSNDDKIESRWLRQTTWAEKYPGDCPWPNPDPCQYAGGYRSFTPREMLEETKENLQKNFDVSGDVRYMDILRDVKKREVGNDCLYGLWLEAHFRNRWLNYKFIADMPIESRYVNGVSLEAMDTPPTFCREWCRDHPEYAPKQEVSP